MRQDPEQKPEFEASNQQAPVFTMLLDQPAYISRGSPRLNAQRLAIHLGP